MKSAKANTTLEEDDVYEEDFSAKKEGTSTSKDAKNNDKASAIRSKHSVTEQRRRCKINERFQILRDIIPHGDQKRDTASFLLEVIEYVQLLQEKVQKYEGSYQGWGTEPTKLMPWRHSHWRVQSLLGHPPAMKNVAAPGTPITGKLEDMNVCINPSAMPNIPTQLEQDSNQEFYRVSSDPQMELGEKVTSLPSPFQVHTPIPARNDGILNQPSQGHGSDGLSLDCPTSSGDGQTDQSIVGGTINISSSYSHELLTTLTQALQSSGVDLSKASISIRIDLGKRANKGLPLNTSEAMENKTASCNPGVTHHRDGNCREEFDQAQKRLKTS